VMNTATAKALGLEVPLALPIRTEEPRGAHTERSSGLVHAQADCRSSERERADPSGLRQGLTAIHGRSEVGAPIGSVSPAKSP
jgi:hypothetical protein